MKKILSIVIASSLFFFGCIFINNETSYREIGRVKEISGIKREVEIVEEVIDNRLFNIAIPKINVSNQVYKYGSEENTIDLNVEIMRESDLPTTKRGNVIIGAHSGIGKYAYFKDLDKLNIKDDILITYEGKDYWYSISNMYRDNKDGKIKITRDIDKDTLTLYTCMPNDKNNFLVVIAYKK